MVTSLCRRGGGYSKGVRPGTARPQHAAPGTAHGSTRRVTAPVLMQPVVNRASHSLATHTGNRESKHRARDGHAARRRHHTRAGARPGSDTRACQTTHHTRRLQRRRRLTRRSGNERRELPSTATRFRGPPENSHRRAAAPRGSAAARRGHPNPMQPAPPRPGETAQRHGTRPRRGAQLRQGELERSARTNDGAILLVSASSDGCGRRAWLLERGKKICFTCSLVQPGPLGAASRIPAQSSEKARKGQKRPGIQGAAFRERKHQVYEFGGPQEYLSVDRFGLKDRGRRAAGRPPALDCTRHATTYRGTLIGRAIMADDACRGPSLGIPVSGGHGAPGSREHPSRLSPTRRYIGCGIGCVLTTLWLLSLVP